MRLIITVDTEADNQWLIPSVLSTENLRFIPRFHHLCCNYSFPVTYLVTHEICENIFAKNIFIPWLSEGTCEIGAHLHPWSVVNSGKDKILEHPFPSEYNYQNLKSMIGSLTNSIENTFDIKPISYRAGRYGICSNQITVLGELGFKIDSSITPNMSWYDRKRPRSYWPQFKYYNYYIYEIDASDIRRKGKSGILEVPITTFVLPNIKNRIKRFIGFDLDYAMFRIQPKNNLNELKMFAENSFKEGRDYLMLFLHSSELMPGGSPYFKNLIDIEEMFNKYTELFHFLNLLSVKGVLLKTIINP